VKLSACLVLLLAAAPVALGMEGASMKVRKAKMLSTKGSTRATAYAMSNKIITARGKIFVVWLDFVADARIATYDIAKGHWSKPLLLGKGEDNHGGPALTMDSKGYLYVIFGPHHGPFQVRRSSRPYDAGKWNPVQRVGISGTYPSLVCDSKDTLHLTYRGGIRRGKGGWWLMYQHRPKGGRWSKPRAILKADLPYTYTQFGNSLAVASDDVLHLGFHIYAGDPLKTKGSHIGYLRSRTGGRTWETAKGTPVKLPATPRTPCFIEQGKKLDMRSGSIALDSKNRPWLLATHLEKRPRSVSLWRLDGGKWKSQDLLPAVQKQHPQRGLVGATMTFDRNDVMYITCTAQEGKTLKWWGHAELETVLLVSKDRGKTFTCSPISTRDRKLPNWLPSIERPFGPRPIDVPSMIYTHGDKGQFGKNKQGKATEVLFLRLGGEQKTAGKSERSRLRLAGSEVFMKSPRPGVRINAHSYYSRKTGLDLVSLHTEQTKSDSCDSGLMRFSKDNGRSWSQPRKVAMRGKSRQGTMRRFVWPGWVDPQEGVLLTFSMQATTPNDGPLERVISWALSYSLSKDGGRSNYLTAPVIQKGKEFNAKHPLPGVHLGRSAAMIGDTTMMPIRLSSGEILQPVQVSLLGPGGRPYNPGGGCTYHASAVLIGKWAPDRSKIEWRLSQLAKGDPKRSTRGTIEPTVVEMPDGRVLMVMRGSNERKSQLPSYRWFSVSLDRGQTWSKPKPWTYDDGKAFYSPSACSQLLKHSNGRVFWIGNISPKNCRGNSPRYPLIIAEVDRNSMLLIKGSALKIDDRRKGDPQELTLSNFHAREDRATRQILTHCTALWRGATTTALKSLKRKPTRNETCWTGDARLYRVDVPER
jgi:BNR repeat-containing family member/BNR repeat-like domain